MKAFIWILSIIAVLVASCVIGMYYFLTTTIAEYDGEVAVTGITSEVRIIRDSYGMPHIYAQNDADAAFALGVCAAQDRLFQMDMMRRAIRGRLSEIVGPDVVEVDKLFRIITAGRSVEEMYADQPADVKTLLNAHADGINFYLEHHGGNLPVEFALMGYSPDPWEPVDEMAVLYYMAWALNFSFDSELTLAAMTAKVGPDMAAEIFTDYPPGKPVILPGPGRAQKTYELLDAIRLARSITGATLHGASNSWVISGDKSTTGMPLLANDMHLGFMAPCIWYEAHVHTPTMNVSGVVLPGVPLVVAGANEHVAWGFTNVMADDADYYLEKIHPENPYQYEFEGQWEDMAVKNDTIAIRDDSSVVITIRQTRHGVVINDIIDSSLHVPADSATAIAMRWTLTDFSGEAEALYRLNRATSIDDVERAAALYRCPGQNWVYADDQGNIGYWAAVGIPIREEFGGQGLLPGWDGRHEWSGYVPPGQQPHLRNPEQGWIATANNKQTGDDYPFYISHCYAPSDRIERITALLTEKDKLSVDDFRRMQADDYLIVAERWAPKILAVAKTAPLTATEKAVLDYLASWDYHTSADRVAPTVFHVLWQFIIENTFKEHLGDTLYEYFIAENTFTVHKAMQHLLGQEQSPWFDNPETEERETLDNVIATSIPEAVAYLEEQLGAESTGWQWGELHTVTFYHPIGRQIPLAGGAFNIGPFPIGGGAHSINPSIYRLAAPWQAVAGASQRHIFDLGDMKNSLRIIPTGVSGNFMSPHYDDQTTQWLEVGYRPFRLDEQAVEDDIVYHLLLTPQGTVQIP